MKKTKFPWWLLIVEAGLLVAEFFIFKHYYRKYDITLGFDRLATVVFIIFIMFTLDCVIAGCALIPDTVKKYALKRFLAIAVSTVALTAGATVLMCNYVPPEGSVLEVPAYAQIESLTMQEMKNGVAVSGEVSLTNRVEAMKADYPERTYFGTKYFERTNPKRPLECEDKSFVYRFRLTDGTERVFAVFSDDNYDYLDEKGVSLWRYRRGDREASNYVYTNTTYQQEAYNQAFGQRAAEREFTLMPTYNGAGKAIRLSMEKGKIKEWSSFGIDDELAATRAEDVRYILLEDMVDKLNVGYWYNRRTGEKVSDAYDEYYYIAAYDLVTGEVTVFSENDNSLLNRWDYYDAYFEQRE